MENRPRKVHKRIRGLLLVIFFIPGTSCHTSQNDDNRALNVHQTYHYNIIIASDLSNRITSLYPKPISDTQIIDTIFGSFYALSRMDGKQINQYDAIQYSFINSGFLNQPELKTFLPYFDKVDLGKFGIDQPNRMNYIRHDFDTDIRKIKEGIAETYELAKANQSGSDIWSYLNNMSLDLIQDSIIGKPRSLNGGAEQINKRINVLILFTDGYIESTDKASSYSLSGSKVDAIRKAYLKTGEKVDINKYIMSSNSFDLKQLSNPLLSNLNILVLEIYDRSLTSAGTATSHPTDFEIIKSVWAKWLKSSKVKSFEIRPVSKSVQEANKTVLSFLSLLKK